MLETEKTEMTVETIGQLRETLLGILGRERIQYRPELPTVVAEGFQIFKDIAYLSRTYFGAEYLLVHEQQR